MTRSFENPPGLTRLEWRKIVFSLSPLNAPHRQCHPALAEHIAELMFIAPNVVVLTHDMILIKMKNTCNKYLVSTLWFAIFSILRFILI